MGGTLGSGADVEAESVTLINYVQNQTNFDCTSMARCEFTFFPSPLRANQSIVAL